MSGRGTRLKNAEKAALEENEKRKEAFIEQAQAAGEFVPATGTRIPFSKAFFGPHPKKTPRMRLFSPHTAA